MRSKNSSGVPMAKISISLPQETLTQLEFIRDSFEKDTCIELSRSALITYSVQHCYFDLLKLLNSSEEK